MASVQWGSQLMSVDSESDFQAFLFKATANEFTFGFFCTEDAILHAYDSLRYEPRYDIYASTLGRLSYPIYDNLGINDYIVAEYGEESAEIFKNEYNAYINSAESHRIKFNYMNSARDNEPITATIGTLTPLGMGIGTEANCKMNQIVRSGYYYDNNRNNIPYNAFNYYLMNLLRFANKHTNTGFSSSTLKIIDGNFTPVYTEYSMHYDLYIDRKQSELNPNQWTTGDMLLRWTSPSVNKGTPEYLEENPTYKYSADNTFIHIQSDAYNTRVLYQSLEKGFNYDDLSRVDRNGSPIERIADLFASSSTGLSYRTLLHVNHGFSNVNIDITEASCYATIPYITTGNDTNQIQLVQGKEGSTITVHFGLPVEGVPTDIIGTNTKAREDRPTDDVPKTDIPTSTVIPVGGTNNTHSLLYRNYAMTESELQELGNRLWSNNLLDNIKMLYNSPIETIISIKSFPFPIVGSEQKTVTLGNVEMTGVVGNVIPSNYLPIKTIGTFTVPKKFNDGIHNYLDYAPYTKLTLYAPYCNFYELDINKYIGKTITVKYVYDIVCGNCLVCLYDSDGIELDKFSGVIGVDIPISASNRAQVQASYLTGAISSVASFATGNIAQGVVVGIDTLASQYHTSTSGSPSPSCDCYDEQSCFIIVDRPVYYEPSSYAHDYGYPSNLSMWLSNCKGFTKCYNVDVDNMLCTESEKTQIKELLESGVYL